MSELKQSEMIHIFEHSRLVSDNFTAEAVTAAYVAALGALRAQPANEELNEAFDTGYQACLHNNEGLTWAAAEELQRYRSNAQPANEPLTLAELRGMDEEPVWIVFDDDSATWALVDAGHVAEELKLTTNWGGQIVLVEHKVHIKAIYRRKPDGGERN